MSIAPALLSRVIAILLWPGIRHAVGLVEWYGQATLIGLIYVSLYIFLRSRRPTGAGGGGALSVRQLPRRLGHSLVCLQMEDHLSESIQIWGQS